MNEHGVREPAEPRPVEGFRSALMAVGVGNYGAIGISFVLSLLLTRYLGPGRFGQFVLLLTISQVIVIAVANWSLPGFVRFAAEEFSQTASLGATWYARVIAVAPLLFVALVAVFAAREVMGRYLHLSSAAFWAVSLHVIGAATLASVTAIAQASHRMRLAGALLLVEKLVTLAGLCAVLAAGYSLSVIGVLTVYAGSSLLVAGGALRHLRAILRPFRVDVVQARRLWRFSAGMSLNAWLGFLGPPWLDYVVIRRFHGLEAVGLYALAFQIAAAVQQGTIILSNLLLPRFSVLVVGREDDAVRSMVRQVVPALLMVVSVALGFGVVVAGLIVPGAFGARFASSVKPLQLLLVATLGLGVYNSLMPLLLAHCETWTVTRITAMAALANVAADLTLIPLIGINGAALAAVVTYGTAGLLVLLRVRRLVSVSGWQYVLSSAPVLGALVFVGVLDDPWAKVVAAVPVAAGAAWMFYAGRRIDWQLLTVRLPAAAPSGAANRTSAMEGPVA
jgi:O-antigen/teichoic acid export membrane protein